MQSSPNHTVKDRPVYIIYQILNHPHSVACVKDFEVVKKRVASY